MALRRQKAVVAVGVVMRTVRLATRLVQLCTAALADPVVDEQAAPAVIRGVNRVERFVLAGHLHMENGWAASRLPAIGRISSWQQDA
jgi:hypothetical protein